MSRGFWLAIVAGAACTFIVAWVLAGPVGVSAPWAVLLCADFSGVAAMLAVAWIYDRCTRW